MGNLEKELAQAILATDGLSTSKLGLRFDRVVVAVLSKLRSFADSAAPKDVAVLVAITAPILLPAKTLEGLQRGIGELLSGRGPAGDRTAILWGNDTRLRLVARIPQRSPRLIGFVQNRGSTPEALFDLAERWLHGSDLS
jgi:hypothetical protein